MIITLDIRNAMCDTLILQLMIIENLYICLLYIKNLFHNNEIICVIIVGCRVCDCVSFSVKHFKINKNIKNQTNVL